MHSQDGKITVHFLNAQGQLLFTDDIPEELLLDFMVGIINVTIADRKFAFSYVSKPNRAFNPVMFQLVGTVDIELTTDEVWNAEAVTRLADSMEASLKNC
jgi:hypothetical protein